MTVAVLDGADGIAGLRQEWQALHQRSGREPSLSHAWSHGVASFLHAPRDRVRTVVLRREGMLVGVLPVTMRAAHRAFGHLTPLSEEHNTHSDWLFAEPSPAIADGFVQGLTSAGIEWDRFRMSRVLEDNALLPHFVVALRRRGLRCVLRTEPPSYVLRLPSTYGAYLAARSAKFRNHLKRVERKVGAYPVEVRVFAGIQAPGSAAAAYARILAIEQASYKHAHGWAMSSQATATAFWRQFFESAGAEGRLHAQVLTIDGRPAAYNLGYIVGDDYSYLKTTFASEFRDIGAATFLRARLVEDLIERGVQVVDFPGEPYEWERQWTEDVRGHVMLTVYSGTARSRVLEVLERVRHASHTLDDTPMLLGTLSET